MTLPERIESNVIERRPVIDMIEPQMLKLIKATVASDQGITDAEVAYYLELAAQYQLDPFAREVWLAKSDRGKLLIMVGRDGLRKIVHRNGLKMLGDVVHADDIYEVEFVEYAEDARPGEWKAHGEHPFHRVTHKRTGMGAQRGVVLGAWARVTERSSGREAGFFEAPLSEYRPANPSQYSPWSKQESVMILAAAERQAARQGTPLGGLLIDGEQFIVDVPAIGTGEGDGSAPGWEGLSEERVAEVEALFSVAEAFGAPLDLATVQLRLNGQPGDVVERWLEDTREALAKRADEGGE